MPKKFDFEDQEKKSEFANKTKLFQNTAKPDSKEKIRDLREAKEITKKPKSNQIKKNCILKKDPKKSTKKPKAKSAEKMKKGKSKQRESLITVQNNKIRFKDYKPGHYQTRKTELICNLISKQMHVEEVSFTHSLASFRNLSRKFEKTQEQQSDSQARLTQSANKQRPRAPTAKHEPDEEILFSKNVIDDMFEDVFNVESHTRRGSFEQPGAFEDSVQEFSIFSPERQPERTRSPPKNAQIGEEKGGSAESAENLEKLMVLAKTLTFSKVHSALSSKGYHFSAKVQKSGDKHRLTFDILSKKFKYFFKLTLKAKHWAGALDYALLRLTSLIAPDHFHSIVRRSGCSIRVPRLRDLVQDYCREKQVKLKTVFVPKNAHYVLRPLLLSSFGDFESEFENENYFRIVKKIFRKGDDRKVEMLFEEQNEESEQEVPEFVSRIVCLQQEIFRVNCQVSSLKVAKQITSLVFLCVNFPSMVSFYLDFAYVANQLKKVNLN